MHHPVCPRHVVVGISLTDLTSLASSSRLPVCQIPTSSGWQLSTLLGAHSTWWSEAWGQQRKLSRVNVLLILYNRSSALLFP